MSIFQNRFGVGFEVVRGNPEIDAYYHFDYRYLPAVLVDYPDPNDHFVQVLVLAPSATGSTLKTELKEIPLEQLVLFWTTSEQVNQK